MRLLLLTHYWVPEIGAPQTRLREMVRMLRDFGWDVRVVTTHPHYPDGQVRPGYRGLSVRREVMDSVPILRLPVVARPNRGFLDRVVDQGSFAVSAASVVSLATWADVMLIESPPLFLGASARWLRAVTGVPYVFHVADPWPDYPIELGALRNPVAIAIARALERFAYAGAVAITTPTEGCANLIRRHAESRDKVTVLPNGVDVARFDGSGDRSVARARLGWDDRPTIVYVGTVGLAQGLGTLLDAAEIVAREAAGTPGQPLIRIIGDGHDRESLRKRANDAGLQNVRFDLPVEAAEVPHVFQAADASVVLLRTGPLAEAAMPTKLVESLAAARPVIVSANGEAAEVIRIAEAGVSAGAEDSRALAAAIAELMSAPREVRERMARNARRAALQHFDRTEIASKLSILLRDASHDSQAKRRRGSRR